MTAMGRKLPLKIEFRAPVFCKADNGELTASDDLRPVLVIPAKAGIQFYISGSRGQAAG